MSAVSFYVVAIAIYLICIVVVGFVIFFTHKKFQDQNFLLGIALSSILHLLPILSNLWVFLFFIIYIFGFIFGILAGLSNLDIKLGALSGAIGIFLSWVFYVILNFPSIAYLFSGIGLVVYILPAIICGALGGGLGSKIRLVRGDTVTRVIPANNKSNKE